MNLREEIKEFLISNKIRSSHLARRAGVCQSILSRILNGKQADMLAQNFNKIKNAMQDIESEHSEKNLS